MASLPDLSPAESEVVTRVLRDMAGMRHADAGLTLDKVSQDWMRFVAAVESGYDDCIYEYTNDLSLRDILQELSDLLPDALQQKLTRWLQPWDERFRHATQPSQRPLRQEVGRPRWWWSRIPMRMGRQLEDDFRSEGIIRM
jgi:hypothetical protein